MAVQGTTYVFSHNPAESKPVATIERSFGGVSSAAVQVIAVTDPDSNTLWSVRSYGQTNPAAVALTGLAGEHLTVLSAWIGNTPAVMQAGAPWTVVASVPGQTTVTASIAGQVMVTASIAGAVPVTVTGSVWVTNTPAVAQGTSPWAVTGSVQATQATSPWVSVLASGGQFIGFTVTSIVGGGSSITGSVWVTNTPSVAQAGAPWSVLASVSQVSSPWISQQASSGQFIGFVVASIVGGGSSITGSVWVSNTPSVAQGTSPWLVTGSVGVTQQTSPWLSQLTSGGQFIGFTVTSIVGGGSAVTGSVWISNTPSVAQAGAPWTVTGSVNVTQQTSPWISQQASSGQFIGFVVASIVGGGSSITGSVWISNTPSVAQGTSPWVVTGSVGVTQQTSPWLSQLTSGGQFIGFTVTSIVGGGSTVTGSVYATQVGSFRVFLVGQAGDPVGGLEAGTSSYANGNLLRVHLVSGGGTGGTAMADETAFVEGPIAGSNFTPIGGVLNEVIVGDPTEDQGAAARITAKRALHVNVRNAAGSESGISTLPFVVVGSVGVTQTTSPWVSQQASSGQFIGFVVASIVGGGSTITGSVWISNTPSVAQGTNPWTISGSVSGFVVGSVGATQLGTWTVGVSGAVIGSVGASQLGAWTVGVSGAVVGSVGASQLGAWTVGVSGAVVGSVLASQGNAPWTIVGSATVSGLLAVGSSFQGSGTLPILLGGYALAQTITPDAVNSGAVARLVTDLQGRQRIVLDTGSIGVSQLGAPWTVGVSGAVVGSVGATQLGTWTVGVSGAVVGSVGASQLGAPWTVVATVTQATSPWITQPGSIAFTVPQGAFVGSVGATQLGAPWTAVATVTQATSPWVVFQGSTGAFVGFTVTSAIGQITVTASVVGFPVVPVSSWVFTNSGFVTTSADVLVTSIAGAGMSHFITAMIVTVQSIGSIVRLKDGTNTVLWHGYAVANGGGFQGEFSTPLRTSITATSLTVQAVTSGTGAVISVAGYLA